MEQMSGVDQICPRDGESGADAIELNIYNLPVSPAISSSQVEQTCVNLVRGVRSVAIPVSVKMGPFLVRFLK